MNENLTSLDGLFKSKLEQRIVFFFVMVGVVSLTYGFLFLIDFLPEKPGTGDEATEQGAVVGDSGEKVEEKKEVPAVPEVAPVDPLPISIIFDTLDKEVKVLNPETEDVATLDTALLSGVVRHPGSADFEQTGTIFLLGHSSYLPKVNNKNFQAFNGIQKLKWGDTVRLRSNDTEYVYTVDRVYEAKASDAEVKIEEGTPKLTLATCNSFGTKDDRFVVEASLVSTRPLGS
jgi:LPXTG-site transpeptidase (sortase) family protein